MNVVPMQDDYKIWDNTSQVIVQVARRAGVNPFHVPIAKKRAVASRQKSPSGGVYSGFEVRWHIPSVFVPSGVVLKMADIVLETDGTEWTALTVDKNKGGQTITLGCVNLTLAADLRDTISIERATVGYDSAGTPTKRFPPDAGTILYAGVPARVQPVDDEVAETRGIRGQQTNYRITLGREIEVNVAEDRVKWTDGEGVTRYLDIVRHQNSRLIDELTSLDAQVRP